MEINEIKDLINLFDETNLAYFEIVDSDRKIILRKTSNISTTKYERAEMEPSVHITSIENDGEEETAVAGDENVYLVKSPYVGIITLSEKIKNCEGEIVVHKGDRLCSIEAMKLYNDIISPIDGSIIGILVEESDLVEYDQLIMKIIPRNG